MDNSPNALTLTSSFAIFLEYIYIALHTERKCPNLVVASMLVQQRYDRFDVSLFDYVQGLRTFHQHTVKHLKYTLEKPNAYSVVRMN